MTAEEQLQQIAKLVHTNEGETLAHAIARMIDRGVHDDKRRREALDGARDAKMALEAALFRERVLECQYNDLRAKSGLPPHHYVLPLCVNRWQCGTCLERATCTTRHLNNRAPLPGGAQRGNVKERFGERIRRLRTEQKLGLREFATKVGISPTYLSRIETSEEKAPPAEEVIRKMAAQLSDSFDELMTLAGRVSEESLNVIKADPGMPEFLRTVGERKLSAEDLMKLLPNEPKKGKR